MLDKIDRTILSLLQQDSSMKYAEMSEVVPLSAPAIHERVKKLTEKGIIRRKTIDVDSDKLGLPLAAFIKSKIGSGAIKKVTEIASKLSFVEEIHSVAGSACMIAKVRAPSPKSLEKIIERIYDIEGVNEVESFIVLNTYLERRTTLDSDELVD